MAPAGNGPTPACLKEVALFLLYFLSGYKIYLKKLSNVCAQLQPTLCNPMDYSPPGSSVPGILRARILEKVAIPFSRGSSQTQGSNPYVLLRLHRQVDSSPLSHQESPLKGICCSVAQSCPTLRPHGLQPARLPCPSPSPRVCSNSCWLSRWCHPTISSSVVPFTSCPQSFPASRSFPMSSLFTSGGQSVGASAFLRTQALTTPDLLQTPVETLLSMGSVLPVVTHNLPNALVWNFTFRFAYIAKRQANEFLVSWIEYLHRNFY